MKKLTNNSQPKFPEHQSAGLTQRQENEALESNAALAAIVESSGDAIIGKDLEGRITFWNAAAERMFGYSAQEILGKPITLIIPQEIQYQERLVLERIHRGESLEHYETVRIAKDGHPIDVSITSSPIHDANGNIIGTSKSVRDISKRKQAEALLRQSEERLAAELEIMKSLYDSSLRLAKIKGLQNVLDEVLDTGIAITKADFGCIQMLDPSGNYLEMVAQRGFSEDFVHHFQHMSLRDETSIGGRTARIGARLMIEDVEKEDKFRKHLEMARMAGFRGIQSTPILSTEGKLLGILSTHFKEPTVPNERYLRILDLYILQAANLIERMRAEEALQLADQHKNKFLALLAHELRNPLASIIGAAYLLQSTQASDERRHEASDAIARQSRHMRRLVDDLLDISRISHGKIELRKERTPLGEAIDSAVETAKELIEENRHTLTVDLPEESLWLDADPTRLTQIFTNLLNNAAKYTSPGGDIYIGVQADDQTISVTVRDNGPGIPENMLSSIFDLFTQLDESVERAHGGLGLGLTLVKNLVEMHGGRIQARNRKDGQGCEFIIQLPRATPPRSIAPRPVEVPKSSQHLCVLVVEDSVSLAKTIGWMLEALGHEAHLVYRAEQALSVAPKLRPQVIMLDIGLPVINGYDLCRRLRAMPELKDCIFVAQTGWGQAEHRERAREAGFDYHLVKPVDITVLEQLLLSVKIPQPA